MLTCHVNVQVRNVCQSPRNCAFQNLEPKATKRVVAPLIALRPKRKLSPIVGRSSFPLTLLLCTKRLLEQIALKGDVITYPVPGHA